MNYALLFPGQGSQTPGMGKDLYENFPPAKKIIDEACEILEFDLKKIMFEGPPELLTETDNAQPALLTCSQAAFSLLPENLQPAVALGHSLGELSACTAAGYFSFADGLKIVRRRGELMKNADPEKKGGMAAVIGLDDKVIEKTLLDLPADQFAVCANYNCPGQVVISGSRMSLEKAGVLLQEKGARRVIMLEVAGAFHTRLMQPAAEAFAAYLEQFTVKSPKFPVLSNRTAGEHTPAALKKNLIEQITNPVRFTECVNLLTARNIDIGLEIGPGTVLAGLVKKINKNIKVHAAGNCEAIRALQNNGDQAYAD